MKVRLLNEGDYDVLSTWWKDWRWAPPARDFLPENGKGGVMVYKDEVEICAGFIYFTNSKTAIIEFIISNFQYKEKDRKEAIELVINALTELAMEVNGCKYIYTSLKNQNLINSFSACGYQVGSTGCIEMIKKL